MNKVVPDANVFLKIFKDEHDSSRACERDELDVETACHFFKELMAFNLSFAPLTGALIDKTLAITKDGHEKSGYPTFSDSMYHAIAITEDALFITADKRHYEKTSQLGNIELLGNLS